MIFDKENIFENIESYYCSSCDKKITNSNCIVWIKKEVTSVVGCPNCRNEMKPIFKPINLS